MDSSDTFRHVRRGHLLQLCGTKQLVSGPTLRLLALIDELADARGRLISRRHALAERAGLSESQVTNSLSQLYKAGVLKKLHMPGEELNVQFRANPPE